MEELICFINSRKIRKFVSSIYKKYKNEINEAPAAKGNHHNYPGGLVQHTKEVVQIAIDIICSLSNRLTLSLDEDILIAGAILHDIGKIRIYKWDEKQDKYDYNTDLIAKMSEAEVTISLVQEFSQFIPNEQYKKIEHIIASHHGQLAWGALQEPQTIEALIVHQSDMLSCKVVMFNRNR